MSASSCTGRLVVVCAGLLLAACSGGGGGTAPLYAIGGTVSGLRGVVVLQDNGGDDLTVSADGAFTFPKSLANGAAYAITVRTQPVGPWQTCTVAGGSGNVAGADAHGATVTCTTNTYAVDVLVTNLAGSGLVLQNNGGDDLPIGGAGTGVVGFDTRVASGSPYNVTVLTQPTNQTCLVSGGSGIVGGADVNSVTLTCTTNGAAPCITSVQNSIPTLRTNGTVVMHSSNVTADETWAGDGTVHVIPSPIAIVAPATVTIQACATVKIAAGAGIDVRGDTVGGVNAKLVANGGPIAGDLSPVVFQNMNGDLAPSWGRLRGFNKNSQLEFHWTYLFGGGNVGGSQLNAVISMNGSSSLPDPTLKVDNVVVDAPAGAGIYFSDAAFTADSTVLQIQDTGGTSVAMPAMALGSIGPSMLATSSEIKVVENANITDNLSITTQVPIHFKTDGVHVGGLAPTFVPNLTLTLGPGVTLKFEGLTGPPMVTFGDGAQAVDKNAALVVQGTAAQPVLFTSAASSPAPGDWAGVWLRTSNGSQIDHAIFEYAGGDASIGPASCGPIDPGIHQRARNTAALIVGDDVDQQYVPPAGLVTNTTFRSNTGNYAIDAVWEAAGFGPALNATNVFGAGPHFCTQNKNLIVGGCVVNGTDESGCLVP